METLNKLLDLIFYGLLEPLFSTLAYVFSIALLEPMEILHLPMSVQVTIIAALTALLSFSLRHLLRVDSKEKVFLGKFIAKRKQQDPIKYISDWKSRDALYRTMDQDLDEDFNTYLAQRFFRYVSTYMLPIFLVMAWLNTYLSDTILTERFGSHFILPLNVKGIEGLTVTGVFLIAYVLSLIVGFQLKKYIHSPENKKTSLQSSTT